MLTDGFQKNSTTVHSNWVTVDHEVDTMDVSTKVNHLVESLDSDCYSPEKVEQSLKKLEMSVKDSIMLNKNRIENQ